MEKNNSLCLFCSKLSCDVNVGLCKGSDKSSMGCAPMIHVPPIYQILSHIQQDEQEQLIAQMREVIKKQEAALVLGAGVSIPAKMPNWVGLVSRMMGHSIAYQNISDYFTGSKDEEKDYKRSIRLTNALTQGKLSFLDGINTLESGQYIAEYFMDTTLCDELQKRLPETAMKAMVLRMINSSTPPEKLFIENKCSAGTLEEKAKCSTISAVAYLLGHENGIHKAMTYNYDPLVQEYMISLFPDLETMIVTHPNHWSETKTSLENDTRELFHVHGFVQGQRHQRKSLSVFPEDSQRLILSEDSYYETEQSGAYNWSSSIQSYFLQKYRCIFVGFSAEDYNFKRILRQRKSDQKNSVEERHFLILTIDDLVKNTYKDVCRYYIENKIDTDTVNTEIAKDVQMLVQHILNCKQQYWTRFGIAPIWITVSEIPDLLVSLL